MAAPPAPGAALLPAQDYPPWSDLAAVMAALGELNGFDACTALRRPRAGCARGARWPCCLVKEIPRQQQGRGARSPFIFGIEKRGYVLVRAQVRRPGWPQCRDGPLPVWLHRWVVSAPPLLFATHACDDPRCVAAAHIAPATCASNNDDTAKRQRRTSRRDQHRLEAAERQAARAAPPPGQVHQSGGEFQPESRFRIPG